MKYIFKEEKKFPKNNFIVFVCCILQPFYTNSSIVYIVLFCVLCVIRCFLQILIWNWNPVKKSLQCETADFLWFIFFTEFMHFAAKDLFRLVRYGTVYLFLRGLQ